MPWCRQFLFRLVYAYVGLLFTVFLPLLPCRQSIADNPLPNRRNCRPALNAHTHEVPPAPPQQSLTGSAFPIAYYEIRERDHKKRGQERGQLRATQPLQLQTRVKEARVEKRTENGSTNPTHQRPGSARPPILNPHHSRDGAPTSSCSSARKYLHYPGCVWGF